MSEQVTLQYEQSINFNSEFTSNEPREADVMFSLELPTEFEFEAREPSDAEVQSAFDNIVAENFGINPEEGEHLKSATLQKGSSWGNLLCTEYC